MHSSSEHETSSHDTQCDAAAVGISRGTGFVSKSAFYNWRFSQ